jgi:hypothetical protein
MEEEHGSSQKGPKRIAWLDRPQTPLYFRGR